MIRIAAFCPIIIISLIFNSFFQPVSAQKDTTGKRLLTGQVISAEDKSPIGTASVLNISSEKGTTSDTLGFFHIQAGKEDTLKISHVGYIARYIPLKDSADQKFFTIRLHKAYHMLNQVDVKSLSWLKFKHKIITEPAEEPERFGTDTALTGLDKATSDYVNSGPGVGISIPLGIQTDRQKQYAKLEKLKKRDKKDDAIRSKFNNKLLRRITGLKGQELTDFVLWLEVSDAFLLHASQYTIVEYIRKMYTRYRKLRQAAGDTLPLLDSISEPIAPSEK